MVRVSWFKNNFPISSIILALSLMLIFIAASGQQWKKDIDTAKALFGRNNFDSAIVYYESAKELLNRDTASSTTLADVLSALAGLYLDKGYSKKAEAYYLKAMDIRKIYYGQNSIEYARTCNGLARLYIIFDETDKAEKLLEEAKSALVAKGLTNKDEYITNRNYLANLYRNIGQFNKAEPLYLEAKKIADSVQGIESKSSLILKGNLAMLYSKMGRYQEAESYALQSKEGELRLAGRISRPYAYDCETLAEIYYRMGQFAKAENQYLEAKEVWEKLVGKSDIEYASTCSLLAMLYSAAGRYAESLALSEEYGKIVENVMGKESPRYAKMLGDLGAAYSNQGEYQKAEEYYVLSKQLYFRIAGPNSIEYATACDDLGTCYTVLGQFDKAEPLFQETTGIVEKKFGSNSLEYAASASTRGVFYIALGQYDKAESLLLKAKEINERILGKGSLTYASSCQRLGNLYRLTNQFEKALPLLIDAKDNFEKAVGKMHPDYAICCANLGNLYMVQNQLDKAEPLIIESKSIVEKMLGREHPRYANACRELAYLYKLRHEYEKSLPLLLEAREITIKVYGKQNPKYTLSVEDLAMIYWDLKEYEKAHASFTEVFDLQQAEMHRVFEFSSETEKESFMWSMATSEKYNFSFNTTAYPQDKQGLTYDQVLSTRNLTLNAFRDFYNVAIESGDTSMSAKLNNWIKIRKQLAFWYAQPESKRPEDLKNLESQARDLEKSLAGLSARIEKKPADWRDIQKKLNNKEAAIEFAVFQYAHNGDYWTDSLRFIALVLRKDRPEPILVNLFERRQLDSLLRYKKNSPGEHHINSLYGPGSTSLYQLIWQPIEKELRNIDTVYFAPMDILEKISFPALPVDSTHLLSDRYRLVQLNSTGSILDSETPLLRPNDKICLFGGVQYDVDSIALKSAVGQSSIVDRSTGSLPDELLRGGFSDFNFLAQTENEVSSVAELAKQKNYGVSIFKGIGANEESFKALSGRYSPTIIHLATHGFFFPDPENTEKGNQAGTESVAVFQQSSNPLMRSGLALAGANNAWQGKPLKGVEDGILTAYEVSNMYLPNTQLVVLSACETGLGDNQGPEGVYGLQRAFKMAGAKNLLMSLWKVDDLATSEFMQEFYKDLFANHTVNDAFYDAQSVLKKKYKNEPFKWAAWILVR